MHSVLDYVKKLEEKVDGVVDMINTKQEEIIDIKPGDSKEITIAAFDAKQSSFKKKFGF